MVVHLLVQVTLHDSVLTCATMRGTNGKFTIFHSLACASYFPFTLSCLLSATDTTEMFAGIHGLSALCDSEDIRNSWCSVHCQQFPDMDVRKRPP